MHNLLIACARYFNSRLYMRGNTHRHRVVCQCRLFQFTPLHERQRQLILQTCLPGQFQFTPLHERQRLTSTKAYGVHQFQFTPLHERQQLLLRDTAKRNKFQFTPLHERQQQKCTIFSIKSTQFSTKPCFFIVTSRKVVFFSIPVQYFL